MQIEHLVESAKKISEFAGKEILKVIENNIHLGKENSNLNFKLKADQSPLTIADTASHRAICDGLKALTPHLHVTSEEDPESFQNNKNQETYWLIDPLDGTKEFISGSGEFTVNIALIVAGEPFFGVVFAPLMDQLYWGCKKIGSFRKVAGITEVISISPPVEAGGTFRVLASKSHLNGETSEFISKLGRTELIQAGSSLKFCRIAEGAADIYPRLAPTCEWDTAAAQAVLEAAGGQVVDLAGKPLRYSKPDILNPHFIAQSHPPRY